MSLCLYKIVPGEERPRAKRCLIPRARSVLSPPVTPTWLFVVSIENNRHAGYIMSFIPVPSENHFPIQNLPYGVFSTPENVSTYYRCFHLSLAYWSWRLFCDPQPRHRIGVAIGEHVLDLAEISDLFTGPLMSQRKSVLQEVRSIKLTWSSVLRLKLNFIGDRR